MCRCVRVNVWRVYADPCVWGVGVQGRDVTNVSGEEVVLSPCPPRPTPHPTVPSLGRWSQPQERTRIPGGRISPELGKTFGTRQVHSTTGTTVLSPETSRQTP